MDFFKKILPFCLMILLAMLASGRTDKVIAADVSSQISVSSPSNVQLEYDESTGAYTATATVTVTGTDVPSTDTVTLTAESDDEGTSVQLVGGTEVVLTGDQLASAVDVQLVITVDADGLSMGLHTGGYRLVLSAEKGEEPEPVAGLYDADGALICTWEESEISVGTDYTSSTYKTNPASPYYVLTKRYPTAREVILPDSVTKIGNYAFYNCSNLVSINIPEGVTKIGKYALSGCKKIADIVIPASVISIEDRAFYGCTSIANITVDSDNTKYDSRDNCNAIIYSAASRLIVGCSNTTIPDGVTGIGDYAFYNCTSLSSLTIPSGVTSIGSNAFFSCTGLTSVTIPDSVTSIGNSAFFSCTGLTSVTIPDSVTSIGNSTFSYCRELTSVNVDGNNTKFSSTNGILFNKKKTTLICYPAGKPAASYTIPDSVTSIGNNAFSSCTGLTSVTIPDSVTSIGNSAFSSCVGLMSITIPSSVTSIGNSAFSGCKALTDISYTGTMEQWSVISKGTNWILNCPSAMQIICTDGTTNP